MIEYPDWCFFQSLTVTIVDFSFGGPIHPSIHGWMNGFEMERSPPLLCVSQALATECQQSGSAGLLVPMKCDLSSEEEILSMFSDIRTHHGGVDVCVNNAGVAHPESLLHGKTSGWRDMLQVDAHTHTLTQYACNTFQPNVIFREADNRFFLLFFWLCR